MTPLPHLLLRSPRSSVLLLLQELIRALMVVRYAILYAQVSVRKLLLQPAFLLQPLMKGLLKLNLNPNLPNQLLYGQGHKGL